MQQLGVGYRDEDRAEGGQSLTNIVPEASDCCYTRIVHLLIYSKAL